MLTHSAKYFFRYAEKIAAYQRFTATEPLDLIKFICTEFWEEVFKKKVGETHLCFHSIRWQRPLTRYALISLHQIDKLQTNHRGVFVLSDLKFKWLDRYVADDSTSRRAASNMLHFPCGIVRGALANLGVTSIVNADVNDLPACSFSIRVKPA